MDINGSYTRSTPRQYVGDVWVALASPYRMTTRANEGTLRQRDRHPAENPLRRVTRTFPEYPL